MIVPSLEALLLLGNISTDKPSSPFAPDALPRLDIERLFVIRLPDPPRQLDEMERRHASSPRPPLFRSTLVSSTVATARTGAAGYRDHRLPIGSRWQRALYRVGCAVLLLLMIGFTLPELVNRLRGLATKDY